MRIVTLAVTVSLSLIAIAALAQTQAVGRGFLAGDMEPGVWMEATDPEGQRYRAGLRATKVDSALAAGVLELACVPAVDRPRLQVLIRYWSAGTLTDNNEYLLDMFNSANSNRPAAYDFGAGLVSLADLRFERLHAIATPLEYTAAIRSFVDALAADEGHDLMVRFDNPAISAPNTLTFQVGDVTAITDRIGQLCPP